MGKRNFPTLAVVPNDEIGIEILQHGLYERELLTLLFDNVLAPYKERFSQCAVLDIGANIGNHTIYFSRRFKRVIAVEPGSTAMHLLQANLLLNRTNNVEAFKLALSDRQAAVAIKPKEDNNLGSTAICNAKAAADDEMVELQQGDVMLMENKCDDDIGLVKIDVEGHEMEVLRGLEQTLREYKPIVLFETSGKHGPGGSDAILSLLRGFGFQHFYTLARDLPFPRWRAPFARAALRLVFGAKFVLSKPERLEDRYYSFVIATVNEELIS